jgi:hypothetical protein
MKKKLLITFDYELFLGNNSGSVDKCMIEPTNKVVDILNKYAIKSIFFVDTTYLVKMNEYANSFDLAKKDFEKIKSQILNLIKQGHYIFPHIHPHWIDAKYHKELNTWSLLKLEKYRFNALSNNLKSDIFKSSIEILKEIIYPHFPNYKIDSYRAGGWSIQPFEDFKPFFIEYNIVNEFSVLPQDIKHTNALSYNFKSENKIDEIYSFEDDILNPVENGQFKEFPISSIEIDKNALKHKILNKILWKTKYGRSIGNGEGVAFKKLNNERSAFDSNYEMVSIELLTLFKIKKYINEFKKRDYFQFISHPKMLSQHNLNMFEVFLKSITQKNKIESDYKKMI